MGDRGKTLTRLAALPTLSRIAGEGPPSPQGLVSEGPPAPWGLRALKGVPDGFQIRVGASLVDPTGASRTRSITRPASWAFSRTPREEEHTDERPFATAPARRARRPGPRSSHGADQRRARGHDTRGPCRVDQKTLRQPPPITAPATNSACRSVCSTGWSP